MTVDGLSDVLGYGDDPDVEPGETAVRAFTDRAGQPAETSQDDEKVLQTFEKARTARACWAGDRRCRPSRPRSHRSRRHRRAVTYVRTFLSEDRLSGRPPRRRAMRRLPGNRLRSWTNAREQRAGPTRCWRC